MVNNTTTSNFILNTYNLKLITYNLKLITYNSLSAQISTNTPFVDFGCRKQTHLLSAPSFGSSLMN
jgi:hypothetical protein